MVFSKVLGCLVSAMLVTGTLGGCEGPSPAASPSPLNATAAPTASISDMVAVVRQIDFSMTYEFESVTKSGTTVPIVLPTDIALIDWVPNGKRVIEDQVVGHSAIFANALANLQAASQTSRIDAHRLVRLNAMLGEVGAPVAGVFHIEKNVGWVSAPGIDVVTEVSPIQGLRLRDAPLVGQAVVETTVGRRTVQCSAVWVEATLDTSSVHCRLPSHIDTVPGLRSTLTVSTMPIVGTLVVPTMYVGYSDSDDSFFVIVLEDGQEVTVPVDLGPTDGVVRVVESQLPVGAELVRPETPA